MRQYRRKDLEYYTGVGVYNPKCDGNIGTLFRTAASLRCVDILSTIGEKYKRYRSDTMKSYRQIPCFHYADYIDFWDHLPMACVPVAVELTSDAVPLEQFKHPDRAFYVFGSETDGFHPQFLKRFQKVLKIPSPSGISLNLSSAGAIVLYHRFQQLYNKGLIEW